MFVVLVVGGLLVAWALCSVPKDRVYRYNPATGRFEEDQRR
jgi:hypothetical protein